MHFDGPGGRSMEASHGEETHIPWFGLLFLVIDPSVLGQTPTPPPGQPATPGLVKLTGADAKRAEELDKTIDAALKADRWDEAIVKTRELLALRAKVQGPKHFETVDAQRALRALRRVAPMPKEVRAAYGSANSLNEEALKLYSKGKYGQAQPLFEKALEINRRLLTNDHHQTATGHNNLAVNLYAQGKYAQAQLLYKKALEIRRRLLKEVNNEKCHGNLFLPGDGAEA
jgi:tetratricopeptide (TPR) repeat protein